ncbi:MAG: murein L,D-transpeptidase catalytic domain family protein, partial [Verrucomicrobiae bacterium]|nr:murein L,D-transpeptidase catalytic domain family protein [Verrucomicrobiae bacterium]
MTGLRPFVALLPIACLPVALATITGCTTPVVSPSALTLAQKRVAQEVGTPPKEGTLIIVDYTKPSSEKRMSVIDLKSGRGKMNSLVAHGVNSGLLYATTFSDKVGSEMSSLGLY